MALSIGERMARVRTKGTAPELEVRSLLSREGVRYRLHRRDLPGTPDVYVPRLRLAIFVHGCFWHGHDCRRGSRPKTNTTFWNVKILRNIARDGRTRTELTDLGIESLESGRVDMPNSRLIVQLSDGAIGGKYDGGASSK
ncbi:MAG: DNA mismatch endonuclease Vsr [Candidatus Eremiobacteraeota bacterium]|nr:DNA mismatch endonuclease Vsr [Candidatus Eremiobacteraeota bacterium]